MPIAADADDKIRTAPAVIDRIGGPTPGRLTLPNLRPPLAEMPVRYDPKGPDVGRYVFTGTTADDGAMAYEWRQTPPEREAFEAISGLLRSHRQERAAWFDPEG